MPPTVVSYACLEFLQLLGTAGEQADEKIHLDVHSFYECIAFMRRSLLTSAEVSREDVERNLIIVELLKS
jgi:hypothetical protein